MDYPYPVACLIFLMQEFYRGLDTTPWALAVFNSLQTAMDIFLVLTGFFAAASLIPALEKSNKSSAVVMRCEQSVYKQKPLAFMNLSAVVFLKVTHDGINAGKLP
jgi:hypothetical protein